MSIYDKPSRELLLEAINRDNGLVGDKALTWEQIATGYPELVQGEAIPYNTRVMLYGLNGGGYKGTVTIEYNRIDMPTLFRGMVPILLGDPQEKLSSLLPLLNRAYGTSLQAEDIIDQDVKDLGDDWELDVTVRSGCLAWQGVFKVRFSKFIPNLSDIVKDIDLSVIVAPFAPGPKPRAEYVAYGYDWTEIQDDIVKNWKMGYVMQAGDSDFLNAVVPLNFTDKSGDEAKSGEISLSGAVYNGIVTVTPGDSYNPEYANAALITLSKSSNCTGSLILHMNPN